MGKIVPETLLNPSFTSFETVTLHSNSQFETWEFLPGYGISGRCLRSFLLKTAE
jgi:hypothetical protein